MRLGVLDIGSNTGHLLVVDAYGGAAPMPASSVKEPLRLAEHVVDGLLNESGIEALTAFVRRALVAAEDAGCEEMWGFATSAVRDADNTEEVLAAVKESTGLTIRVLPGEDEARLTFLAARRWFGWSAGRIALFDIGGGSLEIAGGADESPTVAWSVPLGAARLAREQLAVGPDGRADQTNLRELRRMIRTEVAHNAGALLRIGPFDRYVCTSKTFRSLARVTGAAASGEGLHVRRSLAAADLEDWIPRLVTMTRDEIAALPGVSANRAHQMVSGALVASAVFDIFGIDRLEVCPWALREGVILDRLDKLSALD